MTIYHRIWKDTPMQRRLAFTFILPSLQNPKILVGYNAEVVGDLIAEVFPVFGDGFAEKPQYCVHKLLFCGIISVVGHVPVHDFP